MPEIDANTTMTWLQAKTQSLQRDIVTELDDLPDSKYKQLLEKVLQLQELTKEIRALETVYILSHLQENNTIVDRELREISDYMEKILLIHQREHDNLQKIL